MPIHVATCCDVTKCTNTRGGDRGSSLYFQLMQEKATYLTSVSNWPYVCFFRSSHWRYLGCCKNKLRFDWMSCHALLLVAYYRLHITGSGQVCLFVTHEDVSLRALRLTKDKFLAVFIFIYTQNFIRIVTSFPLRFNFICSKKQSRYRPGVAQRVPGS
jgi:hypothetical protein